MTKTSDTARTRVTQRDIAKAVGVSHVAVSHALHRPHATRTRISPQTRREILRAARELGYQPRGVTTHTIAFVVDKTALLWGEMSELLVCVDDVLRAQGFRMAVVTLDDSDVAAGQKMLGTKNVDGAILTEWYGGKIRRLISADVPWVLAADEDGELGEGVDQVAIDTVRTAAQLTEYLCAHGHRRICLLTGDAGVGLCERMRRGFYQGLQAAGVPPDNATLIMAGDPQRTREEIRHKLLGALKKKRAPTAVLASNTGAALVTLNQLQRVGYQVPEDMSLASCTGSSRLSALQPAITATSAYGRQVAEKVVHRLIERVKEPGLPLERVFIPGEIIERESVARIK
jgi:LacI family transcriptional regulator